MDVCDLRDEKIGTVAMLHRAITGSDPAAASAPEGILEVRTGLFGLGNRLYVPVDAVQEVLDDGVFLSHSKDELEALAYYEKPAHLTRG
jgi:hypothetical protein